MLIHILMKLSHSHNEPVWPPTSDLWPPRPLSSPMSELQLEKRRRNKRTQSVFTWRFYVCVETEISRLINELISYWKNYLTVRTGKNIIGFFFPISEKPLRDQNWGRIWIRFKGHLRVRRVLDPQNTKKRCLSFFWVGLIAEGWGGSTDTHTDTHTWQRKISRRRREFAMMMMTNELDEDKDGRKKCDVPLWSESGGFFWFVSSSLSVSEVRGQRSEVDVWACEVTVTSWVQSAVWFMSRAPRFSRTGKDFRNELLVLSVNSRDDSSRSKLFEGLNASWPVTCDLWAVSCCMWMFSGKPLKHVTTLIKVNFLIVLVEIVICCKFVGVGWFPGRRHQRAEASGKGKTDCSRLLSIRRQKCVKQIHNRVFKCLLLTQQHPKSKRFILLRCKTN